MFDDVALASNRVVVLEVLRSLLHYYVIEVYDHGRFTKYVLCVSEVLLLDKKRRLVVLYIAK